MSYLALARKWRPRSFTQLVGQEHINKAITQSLDQNRIHHAYLFTGTRGVGKTSIARLMAKALNCEAGVSSSPCLQCDNCRAIEEGRFIDLIEIDGASKTRVEDTRDILENVQYAATSARYKIYLIDEVHMLSQHSFNALLKTLEEPPPHVKFLLATTDPQKIPITVLSRCLQFHLRPLPIDIITAQLKDILKAEHIRSEESALALIAKAAAGSMRDALSLLDQAIVLTNNLTSAEVKSILGYTKHDYALQILHALTDLNAEKVLQVSQQIAEEGGHFTYVLDELVSYFHQLSVFFAISLSGSNSFSTHIAELAQQFTKEDIQLFYQIAIKGREELSLAPNYLIGFEMTLLRMLTFRPAPRSPCKPFQKHNLQAPEKIEEISSPSHVDASEPEHFLEELVEKTEDLDSKISCNEPTGDWLTLLGKLNLTGLTLNAAENAAFQKQTEHEIFLSVAKGHQSLFSPSVIQRIEQALQDFYGKSLKLKLVFEDGVTNSPAKQKQLEKDKNLAQAEKSLQEDPFLKQFIEEFSAEIVKNSIEPHKDTL